MALQNQAHTLPLLCIREFLCWKVRFKGQRTLGWARENEEVHEGAEKLGDSRRFSHSNEGLEKTFQRLTPQTPLHETGHPSTYKYFITFFGLPAAIPDWDNDHHLGLWAITYLHFVPETRKTE